MRPLLLLALLLAPLGTSQAGVDPEAVAVIEQLFGNWRYAEAETRARQLLADVEAQHGPDSVEAAEALDLLVEALWRAAEAYRAHTRIINDGVEGEVDHGGTWRAVDWKEAAQFAERAVAIQRASFGEEHAEVADTLDNYGRLLCSRGDYDRAKELHGRARALRQRVQEADPSGVARSLSGLALVLRRTGDYDGAGVLYEQALAIRERAIEPRRPDVARSLNNLAVVAEDVGDYEQARRFLERAVEVLRDGPADPALAAALRNLAMLLIQLGELAEAAAPAEEALALQERVAPDHPRMVGLLVLVGWCRAMAGDLDAGRQFLDRSVTVSERVRPGHPLHAQALNNVGELQTALGDYGGAIQTLRRCLAIKERFYPPGHVELETSLAALGDVFYRSGDTTSAKDYFSLALSRYEETAPTSDTTIVFYLNVYATVLRDTGERERARRLFERLLVNTERVTGPDHPGVARVLHEMARLSMEAGDAKAALDGALRAEAIGRDHLRLTSRGLSERQALLYAAQRPTGLDLALSLMSKPGDPGSRRAVADSVVRSRALVLDEMAARHRSFGDSPEVTRLAEELGAISRRIANLTVRGPSVDAPEHYRDLLNSTLAQQERIERDLATKSADFQQQRTRGRLGLDEVAQALPPGSALVSYVYYQRYELVEAVGGQGRRVSGKQVPSYMALILSSGSTVPQVVSLGDAREIDTRVDRWRREIATEPTLRERAFHETGTSLRRAIWDPVARHLGSSRRVFVVPDGSINLVNLAALPAAEMGYLVESDLVMHYLAAERDLVPGVTRSKEGTGLLAIGGPAYDESSLFASLVPRDPTSIGSESALGTATSVFRGPRSGCGSFQSLHFEPLASAELEAQQVVDLWRAFEGESGHDGTQLAGPAASEAAFKSAAPGRRVLHLATHGFFLGGCPAAVHTSRGIAKVVADTEDVEDEEAAGGGENPLLLSGLVLAGANHRGSAGPDEEDGILTAEEIAALDLSGVEWAVLSACDTGVGEVRAGEGVFGLRRAFQVAGAGTLIMSLWAVEDESARQWMTALYEARLSRRLDTAESVREASLAALRERRKKGLSTHPFYWAGFVAAGDWR